MKVLMVNTYHYLRGGDCRHALGLGNMLSEHDHDVHYFAMQGGKNLPCNDADYFVREIDFRKAFHSRNPLAAMQVTARSIYSSQARHNIARLLDQVRPDIAHLHSIRHHLTKAILPELAKRNIPIVWTLHDFKELCPNTSFFDGTGICERCKDKKFWNIVQRRCKKGSLAASAITYLEAKVNSLLNYDKLVDRYISPSAFLRNKFIEYGYPPEKIVRLPNFLEIEQFTPTYDYGDYLLFLGRLDSGKGLETLLQAVAVANRSSTKVQLKIAGTGVFLEILKELANQLRLDNIQFLGFLAGEKLAATIQQARAIVVPSECYDNYPYSCLEAMACGKPVIASRIGGIPEQVEDGVSGFLFEPFNAVDLAEKIIRLFQLPPEALAAMGRTGRENVERVNNPQDFLERILYIYKSLLEEKRSGIKPR